MNETSSPLQISCVNKGVIPQYNGEEICWMTSLLMCLLFSDGMKKIFLIVSQSWETSRALTIMKAYLNKQISLQDAETYNAFFEKNNFSVHKLMRFLYQESPDIFTHIPFYDQSNNNGHHPYYYIDKLLVHMQYTDFNILHAIPNNTSYDIFSGEYIINPYKENKSNPNVLIYMVTTHEKIIKLNLEHNLDNEIQNTQQMNEIIHNKYKSENRNYNIIDFTDQITVDGISYTIDATTMDSYNKKDNHTIAGITCNMNRYMYNGWINDDTKLPNALHEHDWLIKSTYLSLNDATCEFTEGNADVINKLKGKGTKYNYSPRFSPQENCRIYIYIRNGKTSNKKTNQKKNDKDRKEKKETEKKKKEKKETEKKKKEKRK
tara:strand:- start:2174 stop:3301 length:1128 start_codon:yes stop_codon:yes gene_type:complete